MTKGWNTGPLWGGRGHRITGIRGGGDPTAIHDDTAAEISAITQTTKPAAADWLVAEDDSASDAKISVQIGDLPYDSSFMEVDMGATGDDWDWLVDGATDPTSGLQAYGAGYTSFDTYERTGGSPGNIHVAVNNPVGALTAYLGVDLTLGTQTREAWLTGVFTSIFSRFDIANLAGNGTYFQFRWITRSNEDEGLAWRCYYDGVNRQYGISYVRGGAGSGFHYIAFDAFYLQECWALQCRDTTNTRGNIARTGAASNAIPATWLVNNIMQYFRAATSVRMQYLFYCVAGGHLDVTIDRAGGWGVPGGYGRVSRP